MRESFTIGSQCYTICDRSGSVGPGKAIQTMTPGSNTVLFARLLHDPQARQALGRALGNGHAASGMDAHQMAELLDQMVYERQLFVTVSAASKRKKLAGTGPSAGLKNKDDGIPAVYDRWADGSRPLGKGCWELAKPQTLSPKDEMHKLAIEVAGAKATAPQGELVAISDRGIVVKKDLCTGAAHAHRREVVTGKLLPNPYELRLKLRDNRHGSHVIPLAFGQTVTTCPMSEEKERWETILIPIVPRCYTSHHLIRDPEHADVPPPGWIYVYVNGHLWRELRTLEKGRLADVNLAMEKGKDERAATGKADTVIVLPYQINGRKQTIDICYSEIQWSWAQVQALGGMDPEDVRHNKGPKVDPCPDRSRAAELRNIRMQPVELDGYPDFNKTEGPIGSTSQKQDGHSLRPDLKPHMAHKLPVFYLHNALGIAQNLANDYHETLTELRRVVADLPALKDVEGLDPIAAGFYSKEKEIYFRTAVLTYRSFYDSEMTAGKEQIDMFGQAAATNPLGGGKSILDGGLGMYRRKTTTPERPAVFNRCSELIDRTLLENILQIEKRRELRSKLRTIKATLAHFLDGTIEGQAADSIHLDFISAHQMLQDFANLAGEGYGLFWAKYGGTHGFLCHEPCSEDSGLDIAAQIRGEIRQNQEDNPAVQYLKDLNSGKYPELYAALHPGQEQVDENESDLAIPDAPEPPDGSGKFRPAAFRAAVGGKKLSDRQTDKYAKDVSKFNKEILDCYLFMLKEQGRLLSPLEHKFDISTLVRLVKTADHPELKGLSIIKEGQVVDVNSLKYMVVGLDLQRLDEIVNQKAFFKERPGSAAFTKAAANSKTIPIYNARTGDPIGEVPASGGRITSTAPKMTRKEWLQQLYKAEGKGQTVYKARCDLIVVDAKSGYAQKAVAKLKTAYRILPPVIAVLEWINFSRTMDALSNDWQEKDTYTAKMTIGFHALTSLAALTYYNLDAVRAIIGEEALKNSLNFQKYKIGDFLFKRTIKILGAEVIVFQAVSAGVTAVSAYWWYDEMKERIDQGDYDAAIAAGASSASFLGLALCKLARAGITRFIGGFGPWGWVFFLVGTVASILYFCFKDTELEAWAKHGPFAMDAENRWTHAFNKRNPRVPLEGLMGVLMKPAIQISYKEAVGQPHPDVVVEVVAPGFDPDEGELVVHATAEATPMTDPLTGHLREQLGGFQQQLQTHYKIEWNKNERTDQLISVRYYYRGLDPKGHYIWRARARHLPEKEIVIPPLLGQKDDYDPKTIGVSKTNLLFVSFEQEKSRPGWIYTEKLQWENDS